MAGAGLLLLRLLSGCYYPSSPPFLDIFSDKTTFCLSPPLSYSFSCFMTECGSTVEANLSVLNYFFHLLSLLFHIMITHNRLSPLLYFLLLSFYLSIQSPHPFRVHSSCLLVFNLSSSPSLFSPAAPCNANTTCSEGK